MGLWRKSTEERIKQAIDLISNMHPAGGWGTSINAAKHVTRAINSLEKRDKHAEDVKKTARKELVKALKILEAQNENMQWFDSEKTKPALQHLQKALALLEA